MVDWIEAREQVPGRGAENAIKAAANSQASLGYVPEGAKPRVSIKMAKSGQKNH